MGNRSRLTDEQHDRMIHLRERRWSAARIAAAIGCSEGTVSWYFLIQGVDIHSDRPLPPIPTEPVVCFRGDYSVRRFTAAEDAELLRLEATGINPHQIALALGRKRNSVIGRLATLARRDARAEAA